MVEYNIYPYENERKINPSENEVLSPSGILKSYRKHFDEESWNDYSDWSNFDNWSNWPNS